MGASDFTSEVKGTNEKELIESFERAMEASRFEDGNSPYSGGLGTLNGIVILTDPFPDRKEWSKRKKADVIQYMLDRAEKWENALAVKTNDSFLIAAWLAH